jgi:hypothetical protein
MRKLPPSSRINRREIKQTRNRARRTHPVVPDFACHDVRIPPLTEADLRPGDCIKFCAPDDGGITQIAEVRAFYPFNLEPTADTSVWYVPLDDEPPRSAVALDTERRRP